MAGSSSQIMTMLIVPQGAQSPSLKSTSAIAAQHNASLDDLIPPAPSKADSKVLIGKELSKFAPDVHDSFLHAIRQSLPVLLNLPPGNRILVNLNNHNEVVADEELMLPNGNIKINSEILLTMKKLCSRNAITAAANLYADPSDIVDARNKLRNMIEDLGEKAAS